MQQLATIYLRVCLSFWWGDGIYLTSPRADGVALGAAMSTSLPCARAQDLWFPCAVLSFHIRRFYTCHVNISAVRAQDWWDPLAALSCLHLSWYDSDMRARPGLVAPLRGARLRADRVALSTGVARRLLGSPERLGEAAA
jgi:hypothetical protein